MRNVIAMARFASIFKNKFALPEKTLQLLLLIHVVLYICQEQLR